MKDVGGMARRLCVERLSLGGFKLDENIGVVEIEASDHESTPGKRGKYLVLGAPIVNSSTISLLIYYYISSLIAE